MPPKRARPAFDALFAMSPSEATPALLELAARQAARRRPADLLRQYARDGFVAPGLLDQRTFHRLDGLALDAAEEFEALQLSPVAPLGACSVLAPTSQDRTLSAARGAEVVSDPTNVLALECARRLATRPEADVRLCTAHQVLRAQALPPRKAHSRHFHLFVLAEAGLARAEDGFEVEAFARHAQVFLRLLDACAALGCTFPGRRATVLAAEGHEVMAERVRARLTAMLPGVEVVREGAPPRYYDGLRVLLGARSVDGDFIPFADTGRFDWVARLSSNRRVRYVASGIGVQMFPLLFRAGQLAPED